MKEDQRFLFLDYLRVFAFASVLVGHKFQNTLIGFQNSPDLHVVLRGLLAVVSVFTEYGGAGVIVFLLVSGYIITYAVQREDATIFLVKRFFRIYPLYVLSVVSELLFRYAFLGDFNINFWHLLSTITLTGDLFGVQYALAGVEWTLRLEVLFYAFVFFARYFGFFARKKLLAIGMMLVALAFFAMPIPRWDAWSKGYTSLYLPFLFIGVFFRFYDEKSINFGEFIWGIITLYAMYLISLPIINSTLNGSYFTIAGLLLFVVAWYFKVWLPQSKVIAQLSVLTYSVYLFHNWIWGYLYIATSILTPVPWFRSVLVLIFLLMLCKFLEKFIEVPAQKLGKSIFK